MWSQLVENSTYCAGCGCKFPRMFEGYVMLPSKKKVCGVCLYHLCHNIKNETKGEANV